LTIALGLFLWQRWDAREEVAKEFDPQTLSELTRATRDQIREMTTPQQVDAWFERKEADLNRQLAMRGAGIRPGQDKGVVWAAPKAMQSDLAIVSIHGFSASRLEIDPVITEVAEKLHANVVFTRLKAHGLTDGEEFASVRARDWAVDVEEAIEVGLRIGRRVAIVGMSTGAPLVLEYVARHDREIRQEGKIDTLVLLSPNYDPAAFGTFLLTGRWGRFFATRLLGSHRQFHTENELHAARWTWRYRTEGLAAMMTSVESVRYLDFSKIAVPVLTIYSHLDDVVSVSQIERRSREFQKPSETIEWPDAVRHQLASATFSPERRFELEDLIQRWLQKF
jgi:alpha-beta hydrolase superfamily lysophospholipase